jgi:hypothetical protein
LAKSAVEEAGRALAKSTTAHEKRAKARRGLRAMAFDPKAVSESSSSDGGDSEYEEGGRRGDLAMTTRRIAARAPSTQDRDLGDGRLGGGWELPRSVSAIWASYRAALHQQWAKEWSAATTGAGLRAIARSPPGPSFSRFHAQLTRGNRPCFPDYAPAYATLAPTARTLIRTRNCASAEKLSPGNTSSSSALSTPLLAPPSSQNFASPPSHPSPSCSATPPPPRRLSASLPTRGDSTRSTRRQQTPLFLDSPPPSSFCLTRHHSPSLCLHHIPLSLYSNSIFLTQTSRFFLRASPFLSHFE